MHVQRDNESHWYIYMKDHVNIQWFDPAIWIQSYILEKIRNAKSKKAPNQKQMNLFEQACKESPDH